VIMKYNLAGIEVDGGSAIRAGEKDLAFIGVQFTPALGTVQLCAWGSVHK
jgi:hypothetical protein